MTTQLITTNHVMRDPHNEGEWVITDTLDADYACGAACMGYYLDANYKHAFDLDGMIILSAVLDRDDDPTGKYNAVAYGAWPCPDWPDYTCYCIGCEAKLHEGTED